MAHETQEKSANTTMTVSRSFAEMVTELARGEGITVREFCDRRWASEVRKDLKRVLRERMKAVELNGEG